MLYRFEDWSPHWSEEQIQITAFSTLPARCLIIFDLVSLSLADVSAACPVTLLHLISSAC